MWHVTPSNDLKFHTLDSNCMCEPIIYIMSNGEMISVHNSYDGREHIEKLFELELN